MTRPRYLTLFTLALVFTLLNAVKPLMIDDPIYYRLAQQIAASPLDPYGFTFQGVPGNHWQAPLVEPAWLALGSRCLGDDPFLLKLWLFPFVWLFVTALDALLRRFARGLEAPLLAMTVLSPTFLPSLNLMLDVPVMALSSTALLLFFRAVDRNSLGSAVLAGLLAGVALQTKYIALLTPPTFLLYAYFGRRLGLAVVAGLVAALLFAGWECVIAAQYGESHFLYSLDYRCQTAWWGKVRMLVPLFGILGSLVPALTLLGLTGLGAPRRRLLVLAGLVGLGFLALAVVPQRAAALLTNPADGKALLTWNQALFGALGILACVTSARVGRRLLQVQPTGLSADEQALSHRDDRFLICWLLLELAGYCFLSPFPAARRVMGLVVVATLLAGRLAVRTCAAADRQVLVRRISLVGVLLGLGFYGVDVRDSWAERRATEQAVRWIRQRQPEAGIWYSGSWGFAYHAQHNGLKWLPLSGEGGEPGDWLVDDSRHIGGVSRVLEEHAERVTRVCVDSVFHLRTVPCFYGGRSALEHHDGPLVQVDIYRLR